MNFNVGLLHFIKNFHVKMFIDILEIQNAKALPKKSISFKFLSGNNIKSCKNYGLQRYFPMQLLSALH